MVSKIWLLNVILALFAVFFGLKAYGVWSEDGMGANTDNPAGQSVRALKTPVKTVDEWQVLPESAYSVVISKNLFSPRRTEAPSIEEGSAEKKQTLTTAEQKNLEQLLKKMTLYGLVITDDSARALVTDVTYKPIVKRGRTVGKELNVKQTKWIRVGDLLGEFKVTEIKSDRVLLMAGEQGYDLLLYDKDKVKTRTAVGSKTGPTVVGTTPPKSAIETKTPNRNPFAAVPGAAVPGHKKPLTPEKIMGEAAARAMETRKEDAKIFDR